MINSYYLQESVIEKMKDVLEKKSSMQLYDFIQGEGYKILLTSLLKSKNVFVPELFSYKVRKFNDKKLLMEISEFLFKLTGKRYSLISHKLYCFSHKDYTLLSNHEADGITVIFELTNSWYVRANGYSSFVSDSKEILRIEPHPNSVSIVRTKPAMRSFIKYVNHLARKDKRCFIELKYG